MSRKNTMLGLAALAAFGFAATSFAQCPSGPVPPWSAQTALSGTVDIVDGGFDGTSCRMDAAITGDSGFAGAFVRDDTPADEPTYRAQFLIDADALTGMNATQVARVFAATTESAHMGTGDLVAMTVFGNFAGTAKTLGIYTVCTEQSSGRCSTTTPLAAGVNRVEIAWEKGTPGQLRVWVNNGNESSPTATINATNASWGGVDAAVLGLTASSAGFRANQLGNAVGFDEFDSRRTTFIGE